MSSEKSSFVTLTYDDDNLPKNGSLDQRDVQLFLKRLRNKYADRRIRYYYCGEYGERTERPHYHMALFGVCYSEEDIIKDAWKKGNVMVGDLTKNSARYISGYILKTKKELLTDMVDKNGVIIERAKEFARMSLKPPIGGIAIDRLIESAIGKTERVEKLRIGKKDFYLGKTLQKRFDAGLNYIDSGEAFHEYQTELFRDNFRDGELFLDNFLKETEQLRNQQNKRHNIFNSKRRV